MKHSDFRLFFITNVPDLAEFVWTHGVDRLFVDLEFNGKLDRQGHLSTVISRHSFDDLAAVRRAVPEAEVMVRLNPLYAGTKNEVNQAIAIGADVLMLPMFRSAAELATFCELVGGRCGICPLVETVGAMNDIAAIARLPHITELHIGLNDLHLELGDHFIFEPLAAGRVDRMAAVLRDAGIRFGFGGVARVGEGLLPAETILGEHVRLGSTAAILSRTFHRESVNRQSLSAEMDFGAELAKLRDAYRGHQDKDAAALLDLHGEVQRLVGDIVATKLATGSQKTG